MLFLNYNFYLLQNISDNDVNAQYLPITKLFYFLKASLISYNVLPQHVVYNNLKHFFTILKVLISRKQSIYVVIDDQFHILYKSSRKSIKSIKRLNTMVFLGSVKTKYAYKFSNIKTMLTFKSFTNEIEFNLNLYPLFFDTRNPINSYICYLTLKYFVQHTTITFKKNSFYIFFKNIFYFTFFSKGFYLQ